MILKVLMMTFMFIVIKEGVTDKFVLVFNMMALVKDYNFLLEQLKNFASQVQVKSVLLVQTMEHQVKY